jgi:hypothetical protein
MTQNNSYSFSSWSSSQTIIIRKHNQKALRGRARRKEKKIVSLPQSTKNMYSQNLHG